MGPKMVSRKGGSSQGWFLGWGDPGSWTQDPPFLGHKEGGGGSCLGSPRKGHQQIEFGLV